MAFIYLQSIKLFLQHYFQFLLTHTLNTFYHKFYFSFWSPKDYFFQMKATKAQNEATFQI